MTILQKIRIVLVETTHPGNIGSAARAMKTMGLSKLYLVKPKILPDGLAKAMASGADDVLEQAIVVEHLDDALAGCQLVVGASARLRRLVRPTFDPRELAQHVIKEAQTLADNVEIAIIFGREHAGLTNEEMHSCHYLVNIPSNPEFSSLNLAMSVQVMCYELRMALPELVQIPEKPVDVLASSDEMALFYEHLEQTLTDIFFLRPHSPKQLMPRLKRFFNRARPEQMEVNILRGILSAVDYQKRRLEEQS